MSEQAKPVQKTLAEKIAAASIAVGAFVADKLNAEQGYKYISADAVLSRGGDALARAGVSVMPAVIAVDVLTVERPNKSPRQDARVSFVMNVSDGAETKELPWVGFGSDYSVPDKAVYKAITSGHKYFLMKLLNIGAGNEDSEHETEDERPARKPQAQPAGEAKKPSGTAIATLNNVPAAEWQSACKTIAGKWPAYAKDGQPNFHHILGAAMAEGFPEINANNWQVVIEAVNKRAERKAQAAAPAKS